MFVIAWASLLEINDFNLFYSCYMNIYFIAKGHLQSADNFFY